MPLQVPQLDDRSFEQLVAEARARIPVHTPEWTNFNESDPGITIVELFAFMTENLLYRSNRIPELNHKKFLTLLGIGLRAAAPGQGLIAVRNERGPLAALPLDVGLEVRAGRVPFRTRTAVCVLPVEARCFYKRPHAPSDDEKARYQLLYEPFLGESGQPADYSDLTFYRTTPLDQPEIGKPLPAVELADSLAGTIDRSLWVALLAPEGRLGTEVQAALAGQILTLGIAPDPSGAARELRPFSYAPKAIPDPGLVFELLVPDAAAASEYVPASYRRLDVVYAENVLDAPGVVQLQLPGYAEIARYSPQNLNFDPVEEGTGDYPPLIEDASVAARVAAWLRVRLPDVAASEAAATSAQQARITWVGTNAARVIQALPVVNERLGVGTGTPDQSFRLANIPLVVKPQDTASSAPPEASLVVEIQGQDGAWRTWAQIDDLFAAGREDAVYMVDPESGIIRFGDGLRGLRPPLGAGIRASYEYGGGPEGNVAIGAISKSPGIPAGFAIGNPLATWGADSGESVAEGERSIPRYLRHRDRLVTAEDFRDVVRRTPGVDVGRVEVLPLFNPNAFTPDTPQQFPGTVTVLAIPCYDQGQPSAPRADKLFLDAICRWIDPRRLITTEIYVRGPAYIPIWVTVGVQFAAGRMRELVRRDIQQALRDFLSPLVGGPPVEDAPPVCGHADAGPCAQRGAGWPLGLEVRQQDLEATMTRVPGVRYVTGVRMAAQPPGGPLANDVQRVAIAGLQLPYMVALSVTEGAPEDPASLLGLRPAPTGKIFPVPVLPRKC
ncbi:putative baseplate assembly protein [Chloroflexia bacterium SDU3-3]|nr:putative baseplate assembly protein [Chloroflexia bacterium SDU3-3]